jgi:hypothetical protein
MVFDVGSAAIDSCNTEAGGWLFEVVDDLKERGIMATELVGDIASKIQRVLDARSASAPRISNHIELLKRLQAQISATDKAIEKLHADPTFPEGVREKFKTLSSRFSEPLRRLIDDFDTFSKRLTRGTVNICVTGQARVGKSTFLQSVSGLTDKEIPTGSGVPVTAVRSRILHNSRQSVAVITFHTFESFRDSVLLPYHSALGLAPAPATFENFRGYKYPDPGSIDRGEHAKVTLLVRLREMQRFLPTYEHLLNAAPREISLDQLRQYVAYPPPSDDRSPRLYLAVKDVRIECPFPYTQVEGLGLIDLPGLGELTPEAEDRHLQGLRNEVDFVLWLKRPVEGLGYWSQQDGNLANLLDRARGSISYRRDFVWIVINTGGVSAQQIESLEQDILVKANESIKDKHFPVLKADTKDPKAIFENVMSPILEHLAERLPAMDAQIVAPLYRQSGILAHEIKKSLDILAGELRDLRTQYYVPSEIERLGEMAKELRKDLAGDLQTLIDEIQPKENHDGGRLSGFTEEYKAALEESNHKLNAWIDAAFDVGTEQWMANAQRRIKVDIYPEKLIVDEIHHIRTKLVRELFTLDNLLRRNLRRLWDLVGETLAKRLGNLLPADGDGQKRLQILQTLLEEAPEPCPTLAQAVRQLLQVQIEFRTLVYPQLWGQIRALFDEFRSEAHLALTDSPDSPVAILLDFLQSAGRKAVYESIKILLAGADQPQLVYATVLAVFEDQFIRSQESELEFSRFVRCYRDSIFPNKFSGINPSSAILQHIREHVKLMEELADEVKSESDALLGADA